MHTHLHFTRMIQIQAHKSVPIACEQALGLKLACAMSALLLAALVRSAQAGVPAIEAFATLPVQSRAQLSPDGHWIAWLEETQNKPNIVIYDLTRRQTQRIVATPERTRLRYLRWSDNETLLAILSESSEPAVSTRLAARLAITVAMNPTGQGVQVLPHEEGTDHHMWVSAAGAHLVRITTRPHTIVMANRTGLISVDTVSGKSEPLKYGNQFTVTWAVDRNGKPLAREDWDWRTNAYRLLALRGDSVVEILRSDDANPPILAGVLPDDSALVVLATNGRAHQAAWALPLDGSAQKLLAEDPDADITATYTDPYSGSIIGVFRSGTTAQVHWLDATAQHRQEVLDRSFPGRAVETYGWTVDGTKVLARVESPSSAPVYYLIDFTSHRADIAAEEYPALADVKLGELKQLTYKARDGTDIPAYLTVPPERAAGPGPLIVMPHGGPNERDYPTFDWLVQFLVSRGYSVLQPQFRGSTGFGAAFERAGYRQWGGLMQDDVTDGVRAMIAQGIADPHRICIVGMSYGGYAALAGAAFTPELYACAISVNGVSDLRALLSETTPQPAIGAHVISAASSVWRERIGSVGDRLLDTKSPIHAVAAVKAPILVIYGNSDGVVPIEQSIRMSQALKEAGKKVELVKLPDEDHWLSHTASRIQMLQAFEAFLRDNL